MPFSEPLPVLPAFSTLSTTLCRAPVANRRVLSCHDAAKDANALKSARPARWLLRRSIAFLSSCGGWNSPNVIRFTCLLFSLRTCAASYCVMHNLRPLPRGLLLPYSPPRHAVPSLALLPEKFEEEAGAAALLLGTAIGGGFLATPYSTAPAGALPSTAVLTICWLVLLIEANLVADLVIDSHDESPLTPTPSYSSLGRRAFGPVGGTAISATFLVLMMATLVSQLAKGSALLPAALPLPTPARCALLAVFLAAFAAGAPVRLVSLGNSALTLGFVAAVSLIFAKALPLATMANLVRSDWSACWASAPTLLQLHVYCEIVPSICEDLSHDRSRVKRALLIGSIALLFVQLSWSTLGLAAVPYGASGLRQDPIEVLLSGGGLLSTAISCAGITAVTTTIIGTARALSTFCRDAFDSTEQGQKLGGTAAIAFAATIGLPVLIASRSAAAAAFFGAIDFCGAYPVALLWGLAPPLMCLRLNEGKKLSLNRRAGLAALAGLAGAFVAANLAGDVGAVLGWGRGVARWQ